MAQPTAVGRVRAEGGSAALVTWVGRIEERLPGIAPTVGFWASVYARFARHRGPVLAGGLAFFALLSLVPAVLSMGALAALLLGSSEFSEDLETVLGQDRQIVGWLRPVLTGALETSATDLRSLGIAGLVSLGVILYAASRFVYVTRQVLDVTLELDPEPPSFLWRALSLIITLVVQVGIVLAIAVLAIVPRVLDLLGLQNAYVGLTQRLEVPLLMVLAYVLLTAMMRFGTRAKRVVPWANLGALIGTLIATIGTAGLGWYLSVSVTFGQTVATLGSVIALEFWLYIVCTAIVVAAEIEGIRTGFVRRDAPVPPDPRPSPADLPRP